MNTTAATFPPVMTTAQAADYLGLEESAVRRLAERGHLRRLRGFKKPFKFSRIEIDRYLKDGVVV